MKIKFYKLDRIKKENAQYNLIIGERSNGKTYSVLEEIIKNYANDKKQGAIIRRWRDDFTGKRGQTMFSSHVENGIIEKVTKGQYNKIIYKSLQWYFAKHDDDLDVDIVDEKPFCYGFPLSSMEHDKSTSYPSITTICFDEFLTRGMYLPDEFMLFMNCISTIVRYRKDVIIYMLGNTVNKVCPYFSEMGLTNVKNMKQGTIDVYNYGTSDLKVAVEYCHTLQKTKDSNIYFAFDNPKLQMITGGVWEMDVYPHLPMKYKPKDVKYMFFIDYEGDLLQCELIKIDKSPFIYIHRKTSDIKDIAKDRVYSLEIHHHKNVSRNIFKPINKKDKYIISLINQDKIFYQDNEVGEIIRNYFQTCKRYC